MKIILLVLHILYDTKVYIFFPSYMMCIKLVRSSFLIKLKIKINLNETSNNKEEKRLIFDSIDEVRTREGSRPSDFLIS